MCDREGKHSNDPKGRLFYLALPPSVYPEVTQGIKENCSDVEVGEGGFVRIIVEKPFGKVIIFVCHCCPVDSASDDHSIALYCTCACACCSLLCKPKAAGACLQ